MVEYLEIRGYKEMMDTLRQYEGKGRIIYLYLYGEKDSRGQSWCTDCAAAEASIMRGFSKYAVANAIVLMVDVGSRNAFMDVNCQFRKPPIKIEGIPALIRWQGIERLDSNNLVKSSDSLLQMFFDEAKPESTGEAS